MNHRGLEVHLRLPEGYAALEVPLREAVARHLSRGSCELTLWVEGEGVGIALRIDHALAMQYAQALRELAWQLGDGTAVRGEEEQVRWLLGLPGVCRLEPAQAPGPQDEAAMLRAAEAALTELVRQREREGARLAAEMGKRLQRLQGLWTQVAASAAQAAQAEEGQLRERAAHLLQAAGQEPTAPGLEALIRAAMELGGWLQRGDVREEAARVRIHLDAWSEALASGGPVGRRLDILAQELQREWATMSSKLLDPQLASWAAEARTEVDALRQQVQNVE